MTLRFRFVSCLALLLLSSLPSTALAESGRLNLSLDVGMGGALAGATAYDNGDRVHSFGGVFGLAMDWQFRPPFALEGQFQVGGFNSSIPGLGLDGSSITGFALGGRYRFLEDDGGYATQPGGNLKGHLWVSGHLGFYRYDSVQYGFDLGVGYAMSVHRPLVVGPFLRSNILFGGQNDGADLVVVGGIQTSIELLPLPGSGDHDGDGLSDQEEARRRTDPRNSDSDGDGLPDELEVRIGTNPTVTDTDGDGLADGVEDENANGRLDLEETDPREVDTDGGGVSDGDEVRLHHTDPRDPADDGQARPSVSTTPTTPTPTPSPTTTNAAPTSVEVSSIEFVEGRTRPTAAGQRALQGLAASLQANDARTELSLYVRPSGDATADAALAQRRADAIATWLAQHDVPRTRYTWTTVGADPEASRTTSANAATLVTSQY